MNDMTCDIAVIGAGTAGLQAYKAACDAGADVRLIEKGPGGSTCTRVGCMPSKLLLAAGNAAHAARTAALFGVHAGEVRVDGRAVMARVRRERDVFVGAVLDQYHAIPDGHRLHGEARFTGPTTLAVGDTRVTARAVIVATGAHPIVPPALEPAAALVRTHETIFEIDDLPAALGVVGAGALGLELAQAFARLGVRVTLVDEKESLGGLSDPEAIAAARSALGGEVDLHLGVTVAAEDAEGRARLRWSGASEGEAVVDLVLAASGRPPTLDALDLAAAGVALDEHGTPAFDHATHRCGETGVFVVGDAGAWRPVLHEASRAGRIAGDVATGGDAPVVLPRFAVAFTEPNLVEVGTAFPALPDDARITTQQVADNGRARAEGTEAGVVRLYADADGLLLGASIVAPAGEHLGHVVALAIARGLSAADLADQAWYHPTLEELLQAGARALDE